MDVDTRSSSPFDEVSNTFDATSTHSPPNVSEHEPAPSETSSDGLFITQPRVEFEGVGDEEADAASNDGLGEIDERTTDAEAEIDEKTIDRERTDEKATDAEGEIESGGQDELAETEEDRASKEAEDDKDVSFRSATQDSDNDMPDADDASFASQVEYEEAAEDDDEVMSDARSPSQPRDNAETVSSELDTRAAKVSHEDVEMIDSASVQTETAVALPSLQQQGTSKTVAAEAISEVAATTVATDEASMGLPREEQTVDASMSDGEVASVGQGNGQSTDSPSSALSTPTQSQPSGGMELDAQPVEDGIGTVRPDESMSIELASPLETRLLAGAEPVGRRGQEFSGPPVTEESVDVEDKEMPTPEHRLEAKAATVFKGDVVNGAQRASSPKMGTITEPQQNSIAPNSITAGQTLPDVDMDAPISESQPALPLSSDERAEQEQTADMVIPSTQQTAEPDTTQQSDRSSDTEEMDEEAMIQAQLGQEQPEPAVPTQPQPDAEEPSPDLSVHLAQQAVATKRAEKAPEQDTREPFPDLSVDLARQAVAAKRVKKAQEPVRRSSPRITRARSSSLQTNQTSPEPDKEDTSVSLAREALASPSRRGVVEKAAESGAKEGAPPPPKPQAAVPAVSTTMTTAELKTEFTKRLRADLPDFVPLKTLRNHVEKTLDVLAVVVSAPPAAPARAKGGPREFFLSFAVTDPSMSTTGGPGGTAQVAEAQLYRPHRETLPVVKVGDVVLLRGFTVKALSKRGWGLRSGEGSCWAVWDSLVVGAGGVGEEEAPQIRGPPVEGWEQCLGCVGILKSWFGGLEDGVRGRIERAGKKLSEGRGQEMK
ncbi:hypothetical protein VTK26DRAFT_6377 [Humicola hyalothermophila]